VACDPTDSDWNLVKPSLLQLVDVLAASYLGFTLVVLPANPRLHDSAANELLSTVNVHSYRQATLGKAL